MLQKLNRELIVLGYHGNHLAAVGVPAGKVIEILGAAEDDRFVRVRVDGEVFEAFETDILDRSEEYASARRKRMNRSAKVAAAH